MADHFSNMQEVDFDNVYNERVNRGDYILFGVIMVLLASVAGYLFLNPDESGLRTGITFEKTVTQSPSEPAASEPTASEPAASEPTTSEPTTSEPTTSEPTTSEPTTSEPTTSEPTTSEPTTSEPTTSEPTTSEPTTSEPAASEPATSEPTTSEPVASASVTSNMDSPQDNKATFAWAVNLISLSTRSSAQRIIDRLKAEGIETEFILVNVRGRTYYRVRIPNFTNRQEADEAHAAFKSNPAYKGSWINRYRKAQ